MESINATIAYVQEPRETAMQQVQEMIANPQYADEWKAQQVRAILDAAAEQIESRRDAELMLLKQKRDDLETQAQRTFTVSPDEARQLDWVERELRAQIPYLTHSEMAGLWASAIARKDKIEVRVWHSFYRDYLALKQEPHGNVVDGVQRPITGDEIVYAFANQRELVEESERLLFGDSYRDARTWIAAYPEMRERIASTANQAASELRSLEYRRGRLERARSLFVL